MYSLSFLTVFAGESFSCKKKSTCEQAEMNYYQIIKSSYCSNFRNAVAAFARSGWHLPSGVAVTSQILCISITLNKKIITILNSHIYVYRLHPAAPVCQAFY